MFLEPVRILVRWLADDTWGVNALLPGIPRDASDAEPAAVTIVDETVNKRAAIGRRPETIDGPIVRVIAGPIEDLSPLVAEPVGDVQARFAIRYDATNANAEVGRTAAYLTARAIVKSLRALVLHASEADKTWGGVVLMNFEQLSGDPGDWDIETKDGFAVVVGSALLADRSL